LKRENNNLRLLPTDARAALVVAHPGHELMVHRLLEVTKPRVFILTDGSGRSRQSRLNSTTNILNRACARQGKIYGRLTDSAGYAAILNHDFDLFIDFARELTETFVNERIDFVAGDALEGYNPMHDVCRLVINAAVRVARRARNHEIANFDFSLISQPHSSPETTPADEIWLRLDQTALKRKISAAQGYSELAGEVSNALGRTSIEAFRIERLRAVASDGDNGARHSTVEQPFYEHYGEKQVAAGHYSRVLRYDEHIAPLAEALSNYAERSAQ
jgi:hypothetical protein